MTDATPLYGPKDYPIRPACDRLSEIANVIRPRVFRVLLWTNPKGFSIEKGRFGQQEIEHGYHAREEDFINEMLATGDRWKWERATSVEELEMYLSKHEVGALVILGSSPSYLVRKAVYYYENELNGPKTTLLEFEPRFWQSTDPYSIWHYLNQAGYPGLLRHFVHLVRRKQQLKFLPRAFEHQVDASLPIWEVPAHKIRAANIEKLFSEGAEESVRLDYKRAAALSDRKELDGLVYQICGMANMKGGSFIIGVAECDGIPALPRSEGLEHIVNPDRAINRLLQVASQFGRNAPEIEPRTVMVDGKSVVVLQVAESVAKRCGLKTFANEGQKVPLRTGRITSWLPVEKLLPDGQVAPI